MAPEISSERIKRYAGKWQELLGLSHVTIKHTMLGNVHDESPDVVADTKAYWEYRNAEITWYLGKVATLSDETLEGTVVHELVHVLLAPMESHIPEKYNEQSEFTVENVTRAFQAIYKENYNG